MEEAEQLRILPTITAMNEATLGSEWALCAGPAAACTIPGGSDTGALHGDKKPVHKHGVWSKKRGKIVCSCGMESIWMCQPLVMCVFKSCLDGKRENPLVL